LIALMSNAEPATKVAMLCSPLKKEAIILGGISRINRMLLI